MKNVSERELASKYGQDYELNYHEEYMNEDYYDYCDDYEHHDYFYDEVFSFLTDEFFNPDYPIIYNDGRNF